MQVTITDLTKILIKGLSTRGLSLEDSAYVADKIVLAELMGKKTHGIPKVFMLESALTNRKGPPQVIKDKGNYALVDGRQELGLLSARFATDLLLKKVAVHDNAIVATINSTHYTMAGIFAHQVAEQGYVAVILNNGGPAAVTPFGGVDPIFGTNPIAIGIPYRSSAIVLDMTTSEKPWGEINLAKVEQRELDPNTFIDKTGSFTTNPAAVEAIIPFGGHKGYGLNFMFEILTGAFVSAKMGLQSHSAYDLGYLFMAYSPDMFTSLDQFNLQVEQLVKDIKSSRKADNAAEIFIPGEKSRTLLEKNRTRGKLEIDRNVYTRLLEFAAGQDIASTQKLKL